MPKTTRERKQLEPVYTRRVGVPFEQMPRGSLLAVIGVLLLIVCLSVVSFGWIEVQGLGTMIGVDDLMAGMAGHTLTTPLVYHHCSHLIAFPFPHLLSFSLPLPQII